MSYEEIAAEAADLFFGDSFEIRKSFEERVALRKNVPGQALRLRRTATAPKIPSPPKPQRPPQPQRPARPPQQGFGKSATYPRSTNVSESGEFEIMCTIAKTDEDKRQVFGWASITKKDGSLVRDLQGDLIDTEELEKAAYEYIVKSRKGGHEHQRNDDNTPVHVADVIESFVVTPEKKEAMGLPEDMPEGWWIGMKVNDDEVWELAKSGQLAGFSVHGKGRRQPL